MSERLHEIRRWHALYRDPTSQHWLDVDDLLLEMQKAVEEERAVSTQDDSYWMERCDELEDEIAKLRERIARATKAVKELA